MADRRKTITLGIAVAVAVLAAVVNTAWIAALLFVLAAFLLAWGLQPKRTEAFIGRLPFGNYVLKALAKFESMISQRGWANSRKHLGFDKAALARPRLVFPVRVQPGTKAALEKAATDDLRSVSSLIKKSLVELATR